MKIVADDKIPLLKGVLEPFGVDVAYLPGAKIDAAALRDADALITRTRTRCNAELLSGSKVRFIATATIGFDHLDTAWLERSGIAWCNAPGCNSGSVAQYMTSVLLNLAVRHGFALKGRTLGVVGVGNVGKKVARVAEILGMRVLRNDPPRARTEGSAEFVSLDTVLQEADIITFHVPLSREGSDPTWHLADAALLARLRPTQFLINSSRGEVVDNRALREALERHAIAGAVLDVWENEPNIDLRLLNLVDFATPHIAGYSTDGKANGTAMSVNALAKFFNLDDKLATWYPPSVPKPEITRIPLPELGALETRLLTVVSGSYDVRRDTARLRREPAGFEAQRGGYPVRREFPAFTVIGRDAATDGILTELGFKIK